MLKYLKVSPSICHAPFYMHYCISEKELKSEPFPVEVDDPPSCLLPGACGSFGLKKAFICCLIIKSTNKLKSDPDQTSVIQTRELDTYFTNPPLERGIRGSTENRLCWKLCFFFIIQKKKLHSSPKVPISSCFTL